MVLYFPQIDGHEGSDGFYWLKKVICFLGQTDEEIKQKRAGVTFYYWANYCQSPEESIFKNSI